MPCHAMPLPVLARAHASSLPPSNLLSSFFSPSSPSLRPSSLLPPHSPTHPLTHSPTHPLTYSSILRIAVQRTHFAVCHCFAVSVERVTKLIVRSSSLLAPHRTTPHLTSRTGSPGPDRRTQHSPSAARVPTVACLPRPRPRPLVRSLATADPQSKKIHQPIHPLSSDPSNPRTIPGPEHRIPRRHKSPAPSVWKSTSHHAAPPPCGQRPSEHCTHLNIKHPTPHRYCIAIYNSSERYISRSRSFTAEAERWVEA
ncbi:uncharacterized protein K444DRAFT_338834 [Hyaloscypha bicolor E]|uniref:Uncharacterized protein n=1 Tax=Hyaloscypha bicolor E TaxID=1095630 RepID=A0A2J6TH24_9HELO|nr:uncharacterized protein K444DRAFT_338834 [Hyaloscypha bicolor E]PMD62291.1 hypothetical protein K444DRAFT_338834 [Hyaloscypha bicolor E]